MKFLGKARSLRVAVVRDTGGERVCLLRVGGLCSNRCTFCGPSYDPPVRLEEVYNAVEDSGCCTVFIDGPGEPIERPDFPQLVHTVRRAGATKVGVITNGKVAASPPSSARLAALRLDYILVSVLHSTPEGHDSITRCRGSFNETIQGIRNLVRHTDGSPTKIYIRYFPVPANYDQVRPLCSLSMAEKLRGVVVEFPSGVSHLSTYQTAIASAVEALRIRGFPIMTRDELEREAAAEALQRYSREGCTPARWHEEEKTLSLVVRTGCRNACCFCTTRIIQEENRAPWPLDFPDHFFEDISAAAAAGFRKLRMVAVEPLEHPRIDELVDFAKQSRMEEIEAWTSGRALSDARWAKRLRDAGLTHIDVPFMGARESLHDKVARSAGAFAETMAGIRIALELGIKVRHHLILTRHNVCDLLGMTLLGEKLGIGPPTSLLIPSPSSKNAKTYKSFAPRFKEVARMASLLPPEVCDNLVSHRLLGNVPPCVLLEANPSWVLHLRRQGPPRRDLVRDGSLSEPGAKEKLRVPCPKEEECKLRSFCPGLPPMYIEVFGTDEFVPQML